MPVQTMDFLPPDMMGEEEGIARQRRIADALMAQGMAQAPSGQMVGRFYVPQSPVQGLARVFSAYAGKKAGEQSDQAQKELYGRAMDVQSQAAQDFINAATHAQNEGDLARAQMEFGRRIGQPNLGVAPAMQLAQRALWLRQFQQGDAAPAAGGPTPPGAQPQSPQGAPGSGFGGAAGGIPMSAWLSAPPEAKPYLEAAARDYTEFNKPQNVRPGGTIANRDVRTGAWTQGYYSPQVGTGMQVNPDKTASVVPGFLAGQQALGQTPMTRVQNSDQTFSYIPNSQLAAAANPASTPQAAGAQWGPMAVGTPPEVAAAAEQLRNNLAQGGPGGTIQVQPQGAAPNASQFGAPTPTAAPTPPPSPSGPPRFGQTQAEQIQQAGQTAANTEASKEFIAEARQNYAKLRDVPATLANMDRAKQLALTQAQQFMGPFGESKLAITKFIRSNIPGMGNIDTEGVTNAEQLQSTLFNQVMDNLKKMDASPSQYQQQVMQEAFGTLRTDPQSVPKILDVFADILRNRVAIHNATVKSAEARGTQFPYDVTINLPSNGKLTPAEEAELQALRARYGSRRR